MKNKIVLRSMLLILVMVVLFFNVSCASDDNTSDKTRQNGDASLIERDANLKVWFSMNPEENSALQEIADSFYKETGIGVEVIDSNFLSIRQKFPLSAQTPKAPDIIYMQVADLGTLVESNYLKPIEFVDDDFKSRFKEDVVTAFNYNNKLYGLGLSAEAYGIIYNKKLVDRIPATWSEYFKTAEANTKKDANGKITHYGTLISPSNYWFTYPLFKNNGGYYMGCKNGTFDPADIGLDNAGSVATVEQLLELKEKGLTTQDYTENESNISQKFSQGQVDMFIYGLYDADKYISAGIDYGYAPLPNNDDGTVSKPLSTVHGFAVNEHTKYPNASYEFLKYIFQDKNQQKIFEAGNGYEKKTGARTTCNNSVFASEYYQSSELLKSIAKVSENIEIFPTIPQATVLWNSAQAAYNSIYFKEASAETKLHELAEKVKSDISKMKK